MRHFLRTGVAVSGMMLAAACAKETAVTLPALDAAQTRTMAALVVQIDSPEGFGAPDGVIRGGGQGAAAGMGGYMGGVMQSSGDGALLGLLLAPIALPVAAAIGAAKAHSAEEVDAAMTAFRTVGQDERLLESLDRRFMEALGDRAAGQWGCAAAASTAAEEPCAGHLQVARIRLHPVFRIRPVGNWNPDIHFSGEVTAVVTLEDAASDEAPEVLLEAKWAHRRKLGSFFDLAQDGALPLHRQLEAIVDSFAAHIAADLYLAPRPQRLRRLQTGSQTRIVPPDWDFVRIEQSPDETAPADGAVPANADAADGKPTETAAAPMPVMPPPPMVTRDRVFTYLTDNRRRFDTDLLYYIKDNACDQPCRHDMMRVYAYEVLEAGETRVVLRLDYTYQYYGQRAASGVFLLDWQGDRLVFVGHRGA